MTERDPIIDDPTPMETLADITDCRKALREQGDPHSWFQAWRLHRLRITTHRLLRILKGNEDEKPLT